MNILAALVLKDKLYETGDALLARSEARKAMILLAGKLNAIECYVMNANDIVIWQSWPEED